MTNSPMPIPESHFVNGNPLQGPFAENLQQAVFGLGCFWGAERRFWLTDGVFSTAAGYAGGHMEHPDYKLVCSGTTGHAEVVLVVFDPAKVSYEQLLEVFWESHNPTQAEIAMQSLASYQEKLTAAGHSKITTEVAPLDTFYYAEDYHQQYLAKNPGGYCGLGGTGVTCA
jgi:peptide-methionine (S)-S-oxide reductase